jgi:hypothetical protein
MARSESGDWQMSILVGETAAELPRSGGKGILNRLFRKEISVSAGSATRQWNETISGIVGAVNQWTSAESGPWQISEVNFGLTVGAEGKLLFIAGASAEASVEVKLTRKNV